MADDGGFPITYLAGKLEHALEPGQIAEFSLRAADGIEIAPKPVLLLCCPICRHNVVVDDRWTVESLDPMTLVGSLLHETIKGRPCHFFIRDGRAQLA